MPDYEEGIKTFPCFVTTREKYFGGRTPSIPEVRMTRFVEVKMGIPSKHESAMSAERVRRLKREGSTREERWDVEVNEEIAIRSHTYDASRY